MAQAIVTKYLGPTDTRGSRIQVKSWLGTTTLSYNCGMESYENHYEAILDHMNKKCGGEIKWKIVGCIEQLHEATRYTSFMGSNPDGTGYTVVVI